jgi:hypothetical protein
MEVEPDWVDTDRELGFTVGLMGDDFRRLGKGPTTTEPGRFPAVPVQLLAACDAIPAIFS